MKKLIDFSVTWSDEDGEKHHAKVSGFTSPISSIKVGLRDHRVRVEHIPIPGWFALYKMTVKDGMMAQASNVRELDITEKDELLALITKHLFPELK